MSTTLWRRAAQCGLALLPVLAITTRAHAQATIKANDDVNFTLGVLGQFQADWLEDPATDDTTQNLFIRRIRLLFGGQVAKNVTFFVETARRGTDVRAVLPQQRAERGDAVERGTIPAFRPRAIF